MFLTTWFSPYSKTQTGSSTTNMHIIKVKKLFLRWSRKSLRLSVSQQINNSLRRQESNNSRIRKDSTDGSAKITIPRKEMILSTILSSFSKVNIWMLKLPLLILRMSYKKLKKKCFRSQNLQVSLSYKTIKLASTWFSSCNIFRPTNSHHAQY